MQEPFATISDTFEVHVSKSNEGLEVRVDYEDTKKGIILWGDEITALRDVLNCILAGEIEWEGEAA